MLPVNDGYVGVYSSKLEPTRVGVPVNAILFWASLLL